MTKNTLRWIVLGAGIIGVAILAYVFREKESAAICSGINIELMTDKDKSYITQGELLDHLLENIGELKGLNLREIDLGEIETVMNSHPHVREAEVYTDLKHKILIRISQHKALVRVHPANADGYYISTTGDHFPLSSNYTERVVVATGNIDSIMSKKIYTLATHVNRLPFWEAQIEQIFVGEDGDLVLIEKFGNHRIIIGDTDDLDGKFERIMVFYEKVLKPKGWGHYSTINAKYNNQVICK